MATSTTDDNTLFEEASGFNVRRADGKLDLLETLTIVVEHEHGTKEILPLQINPSNGRAFSETATFVRLDSLIAKYGLFLTKDGERGDWAYDLPTEDDRVSSQLYPFDDDCKVIMEFAFGKTMKASEVARRRLDQAEKAIQAEKYTINSIKTARTHLELAKELAKHAPTPGKILYAHIVIAALKRITGPPPHIKELIDAAIDCDKFIKPEIVACANNEALDHLQEHVRSSASLFEDTFNLISQNCSGSFKNPFIGESSNTLAHQLKEEKEQLRRWTKLVENSSMQENLMDIDFDEHELEYLRRLEPFNYQGRILTKEVGVIGAGGFADVYVGNVRGRGRRVVTAIMKQLRVNTNTQKMKTAFLREVYVWSKLVDSNILPLLGYAFDKGTGYPILISERMSGGNAMDFVQATKRSPEELFRLVFDAGRGLAYLHKKMVFHSDIKPENIVIGSAGRAMICDFGGARIEQASRTLGLPTASTKGTYSYCSPEKLVAMEYENIEPTAVITMQKQADIWAFGMTIFALMTCKTPFDGRSDPAVVDSIKKGSLPKFPDAIDQSSDHHMIVLRELCMDCRKPAIVRPSADVVLKQLI